jgi:WD40 repeat protein
LVAVIGPSGSGKSSLVLAGVIPALKAGALPGSNNWSYLGRMVPGSNPLEKIVRLVRSSNQDNTWVTEQVRRLHKNPGHLLNLIEQRSPDRPTVLVIDQFEELSTLAGDNASRDVFEASLVNVVKAATPRHLMILTMRSDFIGSVARRQDLQELLECALEPITPMSAGELRKAIERPAEQIGLKFEPGVVDLLVHDILGEPAALPLLQFTLLKLWQHRDHNQVTLAAYRKLGGGRLALTQSADKFYNSLIVEEQVMTDRVLLQLVCPGIGQDNVANRVRRSALYGTIGAKETVDRVLDKLIHQEHFIRSTSGETEAEDELEIAHEALLRNWSHMVGLLERERERMTIGRRLQLKAADWLRLGRGKAGLLQGLALAEAEEWMTNPSVDSVTDDLRALVVASQEAEYRTRRREFRIRVVLVVLAAASLIFAGLALLQLRKAKRLAAEAQKSTIKAQLSAGSEQAARTVAETQSQQLIEQDKQIRQQNLDLAKAKEAALSKGRLYDADRFASESADTIAQDPDHSTLLALEGAALLSRHGQKLTPNVVAALYRVAEQNRILHVSSRLPRNAETVSFSLDGRRFVTAGYQQPVTISDAISGNKLLDLPIFDATAVGFSIDGSQLAVAAGQRVELFDISTGTILKSLPGIGAKLRRIVFSPDGQYLVGVGGDNTPRLWVLSSNLEPLKLSSHTGEVLAAAFSPTGAFVATGGSDNQVKVWDSKTGRLLREFRGHTDAVVDLVFHPDGTHLFSASRDHTVRQWTLGYLENQRFNPLTGFFPLARPNPFSQQQASIYRYDAPLRGINIIYDGSLLVSLGEDDVVKTKNLKKNNDVEISQLVLPTQNAFAFSQDGRMLGSGATGQTVTIWNVSPAVGEILESSNGIIRLASSARDRILTESADDTVRVWDLSRFGKELLTSYHSPAADKGARRYTPIAISPNGALAAVGIMTAKEFDIKIFKVETGEAVRTITLEPNERVHFLAFSFDGARLLGAGDQKSSNLKILEVSSGKELATSTVSATVKNALWSSDNRRVAVLASDGAVYIFDLSGNQLGTPRRLADTSRVSSIAFSPDGGLFATGDFDHIVRIWHLGANPTALAGPPLSGHTAQVGSLSFNSDGKLLISSGQDGTVRIWDLGSIDFGKSLITIQTGPIEVSSVRFVADSTRVMVQGLDGSLTVLPTPIASLIPWVLSSLTRKFRVEECLSEELCPQFETVLSDIVDGNSYARSGNVPEALSKYKAAHAREPGLPVMAEWQATWLSSQLTAANYHQESIGKFLQYQALARGGRGSEALGISNRLPALREPKSDIDALQAAQSSALAADYRQMAELAIANGDLVEARELLFRSLRSSPSASTDLEAETKKVVDLAIRDLVNSLQLGARDAEDVVEILKRVDSISVDRNILNSDADLNNTICWFSSIDRKIEVARNSFVIGACERAVEFSTPKKPGYAMRVDSRGVNRARNGRYADAIDDFMRYVADPNTQELDKDRRRRWIVTLRLNEDPFNSEELGALR